jgi:hypothetical protein
MSSRKTQRSLAGSLGALPTPARSRLPRRPTVPKPVWPEVNRPAPPGASRQGSLASRLTNILPRVTPPSSSRRPNAR